MLLIADFPSLYAHVIEQSLVMPQQQVGFVQRDFLDVSANALVNSCVMLTTDQVSDYVGDQACGRVLI